MNANISSIIANDPEDAAWKHAARNGRLIEGIKGIRERHGWGLKEAKDAVEEYVRRQKYKANETVTRVRLSPTVEIIISQTDEKGFVKIEKVEVMGDFHQDTLLQVVANLARGV